MNILILSHNFPPNKGGIHTWLYAICKNLTKDNITCFVEDANGSKSFDKSQTFPIVRVPLNSPIQFKLLFLYIYKTFILIWKNRNNTNSQLKIRELCLLLSCLYRMNSIHFSQLIQFLYLILKNVKNLRTDLILCSSVFPTGLPAMFLKILFKIPYLVIAHGDEVLRWQKQNKYRNLMMIIYHHANMIIANSHFTKNLLCDLNLNNEKIQIIHPGADTNRFFPLLNNNRILNGYNLKNKKIILTISNLVSRKGQDTVLKALPLVKEIIPNIIYIIAGKGSYKNKLHWISKSLHLEKQVIFIESVSDKEVPILMNLCDVFVMPSRMVGDSVEGFGIVFTEANACGKPVIGSKSGGIEDAILDSVTGYLVDPDNEKELAEKLILLLEDKHLSKMFGENGFKRVKEELNWKVTTNRFRQVALEILKNN